MQIIEVRKFIIKDTQKLSLNYLIYLYIDFQRALKKYLEWVTYCSLFQDEESISSSTLSYNVFSLFIESLKIEKKFQIIHMNKDFTAITIHLYWLYQFNEKAKVNSVNIYRSNKNK